MRVSRGACAALTVGMAMFAAACGDSSKDDGGGATGASTAAAAAAASATTSATATTAADKPTNIAFLPAIYDDFIQAKEIGLKSAVEPGGGSVKIFNAQFDPQKQNAQCKDAITAGRYDAIVIGAVAGPAAVPCATAAAAAGIPLITTDVAVGTDANDIEPQVDGVVATVTQTPDAIAEKVTELTTLACRDYDPCNIIAEVATPDDDTSNAAVDAVAKDVPNAKVVQKVSGEYDPAVIAKALPDALAAHPEANVFLSAADTQALAVIPALKRMGREDLLLIGQAGSRQGAEAIADGRLFGTVGLWPETEGRMAGEFAVEATNGRPIATPGNDTLEIGKPSIVTKDNVAEFTAEWGAR